MADAARKQEPAAPSTAPARFSIRRLDVRKLGPISAGVVWLRTGREFDTSEAAHAHARALSEESNATFAVFRGRKKIREYTPDWQRNWTP
jgi:hypothetical protein